MTTSGMTRSSLPIMPATNSSGLEAATVVRTAKVTGRAISRGALDRAAQPVAVLLLGAGRCSRPR